MEKSISGFLPVEVTRVKIYHQHREFLGLAGLNRTLCARKILSWASMMLRTAEQVRRVFLILAGFTLLLLGIIMIFTPGPGTPVILLGLGLLAAEFVWARRIMERVKRESTRLKDILLRPEK